MREVQDHYFFRAKKEGYLARSAYKLLELDQKFKLFWPTTTKIIDIGCAPGSRLQYASRQVHKYHNKSRTQTPKIIGFDLKKVELQIPYVHSYQQDVSDQQAVSSILDQEFWIDTEKNNKEVGVDLIISDMAPDTLGDKSSDALRSSNLIMETMWIYQELLKKDWKFALKVFMWPGFEELLAHCRHQRGNSAIKVFKPQACRKESKETYIVKL